MRAMSHTNTNTQRVSQSHSHAVTHTFGMNRKRIEARDAIRCAESCFKDKANIFHFDVNPSLQNVECGCELKWLMHEIAMQ